MTMKKKHISFRTILNRKYVRHILAYPVFTIGFIEIYFK